MDQDIKSIVEKLQIEIKQISEQQFSMSAQFNNLVNIVNQLSSQMQQNVYTVQQLQGMILNCRAPLTVPPNSQLSPHTTINFLNPPSIQNTPFAPHQQSSQNIVTVQGVDNVLYNGNQKGMKRNRSFPDLSDQANIIKAQMQQRNTVHGSYVALSQLSGGGEQQMLPVSSAVVTDSQQLVNHEEPLLLNNMLSSIFTQLPSEQQEEGYQDVLGDEGSRSLSSRESEGAGNDVNFVEKGTINRASRKTTSGTVRIDGMKYHCGKDLTYVVIKRYFDRSLKQAASDLGVCPTTLKRACRRIGIHRWPARQVRKMYKTISEYTHIPEIEKQKLRDSLDEQVKSHLEIHGQLACGVRLVENSFVEGSSLGEAAQVGEEGTVSGGKAGLQSLGYTDCENVDHANWVSNHINDLLQNGITEAVVINTGEQGQNETRIQDAAIIQ